MGAQEKLKKMESTMGSLGALIKGVRIRITKRDEVGLLEHCLNGKCESDI